MTLTIGIRLESNLANFALVGNLTLPGQRPYPRRPSLWQRLENTLSDLQQGASEAWAICEIAAAALAFGLGLSRKRSHV